MYGHKILLSSKFAYPTPLTVMFLQGPPAGDITKIADNQPHPLV
jgi:hypothetical protein